MVSTTSCWNGAVKWRSVVISIALMAFMAGQDAVLFPIVLHRGQRDIALTVVKCKL